MNLHQTDPDFSERFEYFAFDEVPHEKAQQLDDITRYIVILAALIGCGAQEAYKEIFEKAISEGFSPIMAKEIVYQATDYLGYGRMLPFLNITNEILIQNGVSLPLENQSVTTIDNRLEKGIEAQVKIFGEGMREAWKSGHINRWARRKLFRGLLYSQRTYSRATRTYNILFSSVARRMRASAYRSRER